MIKAFLNDLFQRIITFNKLEQKKYLNKKIKKLNLKDKCKILDFGCGTGLFAKFLNNKNSIYTGYDIDHELIDYASLLYKDCYFTNNKEKLIEKSPFDLIIANCCFHHIKDDILLDELQFIFNILSNNGIFLMIDLLLGTNDKNILRKLFRKLEKGVYIRTIIMYKKIIEKYFYIFNEEIEKSHVFSIKGNPIYNKLLILSCKKEKN